MGTENSNCPNVTLQPQRAGIYEPEGNANFENRGIEDRGQIRAEYKTDIEKSLEFAFLPVLPCKRGEFRM